VVKERPWMHAISSFLTVMVIAGALYSGFFFFSTVRALVAQVPLPFAERVAQAAEPQPTTEASEAVDQEADPNVIIPFLLSQRKLTEPVNILLLGIDEREGESGPWRTDTMILVSIDPVNNSAAMLSIPRDLWTTIPGYGESRINTAHYTGDLRNYPGGGPALAKRTVWYALGVPVHYYVRIDFTGFEQIVDAIGGLTVDVPEPIYDTKYPTADYGIKTIHIPAGVQHMDGPTALQYARTRHGASDFARMERQQQLLLAARDKAISLDIPLVRIPVILDLVGTSVSTDLTLEDMFLLAEAARNVERENIRHAVIDSSMTTTVVTPQGWMVEVADWNQVRALVNDLFPAADTTTARPATSN
jgi:polyisoprenyl-teichoic acid--peptidoglycan teichoic acid transferase